MLQNSNDRLGVSLNQSDNLNKSRTEIKLPRINAPQKLQKSKYYNYQTYLNGNQLSKTAGEWGNESKLQQNQLLSSEKMLSKSAVKALCTNYEFIARNFGSLVDRNFLDHSSYHHYQKFGIKKKDVRLSPINERIGSKYHEHQKKENKGDSSKLVENTQKRGSRTGPHINTLEEKLPRNFIEVKKPNDDNKFKSNASGDQNDVAQEDKREFFKKVLKHPKFGLMAIVRSFEVEIKKKKITPSRSGSRPSTRDQEANKDQSAKKKKVRPLVYRLNFSQANQVLGMEPLEILGLFKEALSYNEQTQEPVFKIKEVLENLQLNSPKGAGQYPECAQSHIKFNDQTELFLNVRFPNIEFYIAELTHSQTHTLTGLEFSKLIENKFLKIEDLMKYFKEDLANTLKNESNHGDDSSERMGAFIGSREGESLDVKKNKDNQTSFTVIGSETQLEGPAMPSQDRILDSVASNDKPMPMKRNSIFRLKHDNDSTKEFGYVVCDCKSLIGNSDFWKMKSLKEVFNDKDLYLTWSFCPTKIIMTDPNISSSKLKMRYFFNIGQFYKLIKLSLTNDVHEIIRSGITVQTKNIDRVETQDFDVIGSLKREQRERICFAFPEGEIDIDERLHIDNVSLDNNILKELEETDIELNGKIYKLKIEPPKFEINNPSQFTKQDFEIPVDIMNEILSKQFQFSLNIFTV